jgi:hypothetical protein
MATTDTPRIEINPNVMLGKPVIRGTRVTVELVLRKLSEGATEADLIDATPSPTRSRSSSSPLIARSDVRFLADECCDFAVIRALRGAGHDVRAMSESAPRTEDPDVIDTALAQVRILLTEDKDF